MDRPLNSIQNNRQKPLIAISRCLLGDNVRYDAAVKSYPSLIAFIQQHFSIIAVCPEVEIGLSVPRPPVQLSGTPQSIEIRGRDDPSINITNAMQDYCQNRPSELDSIQGYIFKSKSPSCGIQNIPLFNLQGDIDHLTKGIFVSAILKYFPGLPVSDELTLTNDSQLENFRQQVLHYQTQ